MEYPTEHGIRADGPWGSKTFYYDGVGNRTYENTTISGVTTSDSFTYPATNNRVQSVVRAGTTTRSLTYDNAANILTDSRSGGPYTFTYNKANRLKTVTVSGTVRGTYVYNGFEQLISRVITNSGTANGTTHFVHDSRGNVIAELNATGATVREYIYLIEAEIAPTIGSRTQVDIPVAVIDGVNTATPVLYMVHTDQLGRPVRMTDSAKASVWDAVYTPWGAPHAITGAQALNARFPGQWFQLESGLHYNWHRHYDPSLGRYTQPDPLGFVDGPSVYAYARSSPAMLVDKDGRNAITWGGGIGQAAGTLTPIPGGAAIGRCIGMAIGLGVTILMSSDERDKECEKEWDAAYEQCTEWLQSEDPPRSLTGGYLTLPECARGLVSEACGGNKVEYLKPRRKKRYGPF